MRIFIRTSYFHKKTNKLNFAVKFRVIFLLDDASIRLKNFMFMYYKFSMLVLKDVLYFEY